jgi:hypothetical protein
MTDAEVLNAAADLIERGGLYRHYAWPGDDEGKSYQVGDPLDVIGAIFVVTGKDASSALHKLQHALNIAVGTWSDTHSPAEVVATLREVARHG